jgi:hypothetical protein
MPYKPKIIEQMPEWIYELSIGDECLLDVLTEAWVSGQHARNAIRQRGDEVPRTCSGELEFADGILEAIRDGRVPKERLAARAAQAVRKFDTARQCARFMERDGGPVLAQERRLPRRQERPEPRVRVLAAREDSTLVHRARGAR